MLSVYWVKFSMKREHFYEEKALSPKPMVIVRQLRNERKAQEYLEDHELDKLLKIFDRSYFPEYRDFMTYPRWRP